MDGVIPFSDAPGMDMPPRAPLRFEPQDLGAADRAAGAPAGPQPWLWRVLVFGLTLGGTAGFLWTLQGLFAVGQTGLLKALLLSIVGLTFAWIVMAVATMAAALLARLLRRPASGAGASGPPLSTALLVPIYNENPAAVFGNAAAMLADLSRQTSANSFSLFILSDTRDAAIAAAEWDAFTWLRDAAPAGIRVHYRRRAENTDKKTGNLADWIRGWGAAHDAMLVLDADSLMSGRAIAQLADALRSDPGAGLIQSFPGLIGAETLFGRVQQFSHSTAGWLLAEGLALWTRNEGNYWGHNAILRTRAFAASAGLPRLRSWRGTSQLIYSHDFVEAGLLRRAGWSVRFLAVSGSYEETPGTLVDYILRDRRWCLGNLQHLRLLGARGFHPVSRVHLLFGAMSYLMSPLWMFLLVVWAGLGLTEHMPEVYFSETHPLYPIWPEMSRTEAVAFLLFMYGLLLLPKLAASLLIVTARRARHRYGGAWAFWGGVVLEIAVSILYAPILMVQQSQSVFAALRGRSARWAPQRRQAERMPLSELMRFHAMETVLGLLLVAGLAAGWVSLWLLPIAVSLALSVGLSALSGVNISRMPLRAGRLETPQSLFEPGIWVRAQEARAEVADHLAARVVVAAE